MSMPSPPPDNRAAGQPGHIGDHNEISDALNWLGNEVATLAAATPPPAQRLAPMPVQSASLTAAAGALVPCDISGGSFTVTLPGAPADGTMVGVKVVGIATPGQYAVTIAASGSDRVNKASGPSSVSLILLYHGAILQYAAAFGLWYVTTGDLPLGALEQIAGGWQPSDHGYLAWTGDPAALSGSVATVTGTLYLLKVPVRASMTVSAVHVMVQAAGSGFTSAAMGLYGPSGALLSQGNAATALASPGDAAVNLSSPQPVTPGDYWVAVLVVGGSQPLLERGTGLSQAMNAGLAPARYRYAAAGSSLSALPSTVTLSANAAGASFWAAVS